MSGVTIEHEREAHLGQLDHRIFGSWTRSDSDKDWCGRVVVIPDVMADGLKVPLALAGERVQCQHRVRKQVVTLTEAAVEVFGRRAGGGEYPAAVLVDGHASPRVGAAVVLSLDPLPGVVAELALHGNGVKDPLHRSGNGVVAATMAGRRIVALVDARRDDEHVLEHRSRGRHLDECRRMVNAQILAQVDKAVRAEGGNQQAGLGVECVNPIPNEEEDPVPLVALPVDDSAVRNRTTLPLLYFAGSKTQDSLPVAAFRATADSSGLDVTAGREGSRRRAGPRAGRDGAALSQRARR